MDFDDTDVSDEDSGSNTCMDKENQEPAVLRLFLASTPFYIKTVLTHP